MLRTHSLCLMTAAALLGCTTPRGEQSADSAATPHDSALHTAHVAASAARTDSTFAAMQARGATGMGVDQSTSTHTFEPTPDGGRITLRRDVPDSAGVEQIRVHLAGIATAFAAGDFTTPGFVHNENVAGTDVMRARRALISYRAAPIERGGELIISTSDSLALDGIHRFLAYQRREHRAGGAPSAPRQPAR